MQTYHRSRVQIEQCGNCRGISWTAASSRI
nr:zf-TFIIB domain-containing protein [Nocardia puris]